MQNRSIDRLWTNKNWPKTKYGCVLKFKDSVDHKEVKKALDSIRHLLESTPDLHKYSHGTPVFYIPNS